MIKRADWVCCLNDPAGLLPGFVKRVSRDGKWADVDWRTHTKRMYTSHLRVLTTIPFGGDGWTVTDVTRARELGHSA